MVTITRRQAAVVVALLLLVGGALLVLNPLGGDSEPNTPTENETAIDGTLSFDQERAVVTGEVTRNERYDIVEIRFTGATEDREIVSFGTASTGSAEVDVTGDTGTATLVAIDTDTGETRQVSSVEYDGRTTTPPANETDTNETDMNETSMNETTTNETDMNDTIRPEPFAAGNLTYYNSNTTVVATITENTGFEYANVTFSGNTTNLTVVSPNTQPIGRAEQQVGDDDGVMRLVVTDIDNGTTKVVDQGVYGPLDNSTATNETQ